MFHTCSANQAAVGVADCELLIAAYILAGLAMMLNIRLSYSSAPYALIRFQLPENLFSVFVRRMASALELWCLPSMLLGNLMDLIQKLALNTDEQLRVAAGESASDGTLRGLAKELHDKAEKLHQNVSNVGAADGNGAKVLRHKAGTEAQKDNPKHLRKLAENLYNEVSSLESAVHGSTAKDGPALKQKAGTNENDGLRGLAAELYKAAKALADAVGRADGNAAESLANEVGNDEDTGIRHKLKQLAEAKGDVQSPAEAVTTAYSSVEGKFSQVVGQQTTKNAYNEPAKKAVYDKVVEAWTAFETLHNADLKGIAKGLKDAVGDGFDSSKLQGALAELGDHSGPDLTSQAGNVRNAYQNPSDGVKPKFTKVKENETSYQAIAAIQTLYDAVVSAMTEFDNVYRPEEILMNEIGDGASETKGLQKALKDLNDKGDEPDKLSDLVKAVKKQYGDNWGNDVKGKFHLVQAQAPAYEQGDTIKSDQYKNLLDAWSKFNDKYYEVISSPKYNTIIIPSIITQWLNFITYVVLLIVYLIGGDHGHLTVFYFVIAISGVVFGINMTLVYSVDFNYIPVYIVGENCFPIVTSFIHYITTLIFGNRRKWNSDFIVVYVDIVVAIIISLVAAAVWTYAYVCKIKYASATETSASSWHHIFSHGFSGKLNAEIISPFLMIVVGMGLVYAIYPGIAPGMIVPFYLIDKIEMVLLIATFFPPVIVAALRRSFAYGDNRSPMCKWSADGAWPGTGSGLHWHTFDLLMVIKITLAIIFIYCLHYKESNISRSIINQPKMSTFLSITFYMCHECLLALGFPGLVGANEGGDLVLIPQYIGALFMIFLAFYSEGYIIEYKSHDPAHLLTTGMW